MLRIFYNYANCIITVCSTIQNINEDDQIISFLIRCLDSSVSGRFVKMEAILFYFILIVLCPMFSFTIAQ